MTNSSGVIYVLDTNILIELSLWLPIDLNRAFWAKFEEALQNGKWVLLDTVVDEIRGNNDGLKKWCEDQKRKSLVKIIDDDCRNKAIEINNQFPMIDTTTLRSTADTYLIAYAKANNLTIFSREGYRKKPDDLHKIPDVCDQLGVPFIRRPVVFFKDVLGMTP